MKRYRIGPLDRSYAEHLLRVTDHQVQNSLTWFNFILSYSDETDRSLGFYLDDEPVGFILASQYKNLIQSLPYPASYSGPWFSPKLSSMDRRRLLNEMERYYGKFADVFTICTSPLISDPGKLTQRYEFAAENVIHYIDLQKELLEGTTSKFRNNLRRNLRKAEEAGVTIVEDCTDAVLSQWYQCYSTRMLELGGATLDYRFFVTMRDHLSPFNNLKLISAYAGNKYLGGILVVYNQFCADYFLSLFDRDYDDLQASTSAMYHALCWAKGQGIRYFNLQGSPRSQPALIEFKKSWGAIEGRHHYLTMIMNNRDKILRQSADQIKKGYQFHYLVPFEVLENQKRTEQSPAIASTRENALID